MNAFDRYGRLPIELPDLLNEIAAPRTPDYVDDVLTVIAGTRQRPRWTFPERWLPMGLIATERVPVRPPIPWRTVAGVALVILALIAAGLLAAGGPRRLPAPFGIARNGAILLGDGDIRIRDAIDGSTRLLVGGPTDDFAANFTRDGTHLVWLRRVSGTPGGNDERLAFFVADADGTNARQASDGLIAPDMWDISADGSMIVAQTGDPSIGQKLVTIDLVGTAGTRPLDVHDPQMTMSWPNFLGPNGAEVVFRGRTSTPAGLRAGVFAVHADGSGLRPLTQTDGLIDGSYQLPQGSPDGRFVTYTRWDPVTQLDAIRVIDLTTGDDRALDPGATRNEAYASFSPDSRSLMFIVYDGTWRSIWREPLDGSRPAIAVGPRYRVVDGSYLSGRFSPDGRSILVIDEGSQEARLVDVEAGGDGRIIEWTPSDSYAWQRLAP
jgi:hypothetical protein